MKKYHYLYIIIIIGIFIIFGFTLYERLSGNLLQFTIQECQVNNKVYEKTPFKIIKNTNILI